MSMVVLKCFIKHMCFIVLYFDSHAFFSLEIAKKCFFVLYFLKNVLYFCKLFKWVVLGYHADTPITIKAEASSKADSRPN